VEKPTAPETIIGALKFVLSPISRPLAIMSTRAASSVVLSLRGRRRALWPRR
jgi:hypothetical protein